MFYKGIWLWVGYFNRPGPEVDNSASESWPESNFFNYIAELQTPNAQLC